MTLEETLTDQGVLAFTFKALIIVYISSRIDVRGVPIIIARRWLHEFLHDLNLQAPIAPLLLC